MSITYYEYMQQPLSLKIVRRGGLVPLPAFPRVHYGTRQMPPKRSGPNDAVASRVWPPTLHACRFTQRESSSSRFALLASERCVSLSGNWEQAPQNEAGVQCEALRRSFRGLPTEPSATATVNRRRLAAYGSACATGVGWL